MSSGPVTIMSDGAIKRQGDSLVPQGVVFQAVRTSTYTPAAQGTPIAFDTKRFDPYGFYDTSTGRFTPKIAGFYRVFSSVHYSNSGSGSYVGTTLNRNGAAIKTEYGFWANATNGVSIPCEDILYFNGTTDYAYVSHLSAATRQIYGTAGGGSDGDLTWFMAELVGASVGVIPEPWHVVGSGGSEPGFQNGWAGYNSGLAFCKMPDGTVYLKGEAVAGTWTAGTAIFTLPVGYRPLWRGYFPVYMNQAPNVGVVGVQTNGEVQTEIRAGTATHIHGFGAISFRAEQ